LDVLKLLVFLQQPRYTGKQLNFSQWVKTMHGNV